MELIFDEKFRPRNILAYPPGNSKIFEEYFYDEYSKIKITSERIYIPIFWTNYYISKDYGNGDISELQNLLNSLDRNKKYFTIVQYDDNILNDISDLDILIFCQGGYGRYLNKSYAIPLNCQNPLEYKKEKNIFCSFIGRKTHNIRDLIFDKFKNKEGYLISETTDYDSFVNTMRQSLFSFCPRGYGMTSFRIFESLSAGSIPIYIYDNPLIPFEDKFSFSDIGILLKYSDLYLIDDILRAKTKTEIDNYLVNGETIYKDFFTYAGCYNKIISIVNNKSLI